MFCDPREDAATDAVLQAQLTGALIGLARATENNEDLLTASTHRVLLESLAATAADADAAELTRLLEQVNAEKKKLVPDCFVCTAPCGRNSDYDLQNLLRAQEDVRSLKNTILMGIRAIAVCAIRAAEQGREDESVYRFLYKALNAVGMDHLGADRLLPMVLELGQVHLLCTELQTQGHTPAAQKKAEKERIILLN